MFQVMESPVVCLNFRAECVTGLCLVAAYFVQCCNWPRTDGDVVSTGR